ncbi:MAG: phytanoyl-CoA dioxygenase family protein, partial [Actinomycetes bacterium]
MKLAPPLPAAFDPVVLKVFEADLANAGGLTFYVDHRSLTYSYDGKSIASREGFDGGSTAVRLTHQAWDDLTGQMLTLVGLMLSDNLILERGSFDQLFSWEPLLRYFHAGILPYDSSRVQFNGRDPLACFTLTASDEELAAQLSTMGYLHVKDVFSAAEMKAANAEVDRLAELAEPGDDESWWVTREDGTSALCRLVYASLRSPLFAAMEQDPRIRRLATLLDPTLKTAPDRMEGAAILIKVPGKTDGLSNIPWHTDCGTGGHAFFCPAVAIGIQFTGSNAEKGNLKVVPGSHGQTLPFQWQSKIEDIPVVSIDTEPGDVTIHIQDLTHSSPKPTGEGLR